MTSEEIKGPYVAKPQGMNDEYGIVCKIGPRGGSYFVASYWSFSTAESVARMLNVYHELERS